MSYDPAVLVLADGSVFKGRSIGAQGTACGELVFNTAMTGYQEILTDPSYARQLVMLTTAHVGNTGCALDDSESSRVWASGLIVRNGTMTPSNYRADISLPDWLQKHKVVAIADIDTRHVTRHIRDNGAMPAIISTEAQSKETLLDALKSFKGLEGVDLACEVSRQTIQRWHEGRKEWGRATKPQQYHVVAYDFGVKHNILRILYDLGCHITLVPAKTPAKEVLAMNPDGVLLSNGPGDPKACDYAIAAAQTLMESGIPLFGICLGFQILALACGAQSKKMKFGHHGANHPVMALDGASRVFISSQNHGFCIDEASLPASLKATHRSLFDNSLQGLRHTRLPVMGFQGHPEASPGPHDIEVIFDSFINDIKVWRENAAKN